MAWEEEELTREDLERALETQGRILSEAADRIEYLEEILRFWGLPEQVLCDRAVGTPEEIL